MSIPRVTQKDPAILTENCQNAHLAMNVQSESVTHVIKVMSESFSVVRVPCMGQTDPYQNPVWVAWKDPF